MDGSTDKRLLVSSPASQSGQLQSASRLARSRSSVVNANPPVTSFNEVEGDDRATGGGSLVRGQEGGQIVLQRLLASKVTVRSDDDAFKPLWGIIESHNGLQFSLQ